MKWPNRGSYVNQSFVNKIIKFSSLNNDEFCKKLTNQRRNSFFFSLQLTNNKIHKHKSSCQDIIYVYFSLYLNTITWSLVLKTLINIHEILNLYKNKALYLFFLLITRVNKNIVYMIFSKVENIWSDGWRIKFKCVFYWF